MYILVHLIAALASVLPFLLAIQKGRNGDFDYIYQRTIDYTSSFQVPNILSFLIPNQNQDFFAPVVVPLVNVTNVTISQPVTSQIDTQLDEQPAYLNVTGGPSYTAPSRPSVFHRYRQAAFCVADAWLGFSKYVLLVFNGLIRMMEDLRDFSTELHLHHHDFSHASTPRTRKALVIAFRSLLRSFGRRVLPFVFVMAMLSKLSVAVSFLVSIGLGYYVYTLLQALAQEKEDLKQLIAQAEILHKDLDQQVMLLVEKQEDLKLRETAEKQLQAQANSLQKDLDQRTKMLTERQEDLKRHERTVEQLRTHASSLQQDLDQRAKLLAEGQESLKQQETTTKKLQAHADTLQHDLEQHKKLLEDQRHEIDEFQDSSKKQLRDSQAKIVSLEEETLAQLHHNGKAQEQALEKAREEAQRLQAGNQALDGALMTERQRSYRAHDQARAMEAKHTETSRRFNAVNISYENQKQTLKQRTARIEELSFERDQLAQTARAAEAAAQKLRDSLQKLEIDFTNKVSAMTSLERQLQEKDSQLDQKAAELEMSHSKNDELSQKLMEADSRSQSLEDEVKRLENDLSRKSSTADEYKQQVERQQSISEQKAAEMVNLQSKLDGVYNELAAAQQAEQTLGERVKGLEGDLSLKSSAVEASEQQIQQLHKALDQKALEMASLRQELVALGHEHEAAHAREAALTERAQGLERDLEHKSSAIETLEAQVKQERRSLGQKTADLTTAETRLAALRQDNAMARARAEKLEERVSRLQHELDVKTSSVEAYERNSEHQELVLERRNTELSQALELVRNLEGQLETLRTGVETRSHDRNSKAEHPTVQGDEEYDTGYVAEPEAQRLAHEADSAHHATPNAPESQDVAEGAEEEEEAPARKRGHRRKRGRAGKRQAAKLAAKRQPIPRRHSFDSHAHKSCLRCGGPLPVKVSCIPKELQQASREKPAESGMPVRNRRHSLESLALRPCPECGGPLPVKVDFVFKAGTMLEGDRAGASSTGEVIRPEPGQTAVSQELSSSQSADATIPERTDHALTSPTFPTFSHTPQHDEVTEADGAQDQAAAQSIDTPSADLRRRRRHKGKGHKPTNEQEQTGELNSQQDSTEAQDVAQSPAPSMLSSRWGPEGSASPRPNPPPPGPSSLFSRWIYEGSMSPQPTLPPRPNFSPQQPAPFTSSPSNVFAPHRPPGQNVGFGYNFGQPPRHPFSPSNTGFSPSGFVPSYNAGPTWAPGQRAPLFNGLATPAFPQSPFPPQGASRGHAPFQPSQPFNPSARDFRPAQPFPLPSPNNNLPGQGANRGSAGPPHRSNVSKWAD